MFYFFFFGLEVFKDGFSHYCYFPLETKYKLFPMNEKIHGLYVKEQIRTVVGILCE